MHHCVGLHVITRKIAFDSLENEAQHNIIQGACHLTLTHRLVTEYGLNGTNHCRKDIAFQTAMICFLVDIV